MNRYKVLKSPYITEKTNLLKDTANQIAFKVAVKTNKKEVKKAVEQIFSVTVEKVSIANQRGKYKRIGKNTGKKPDWKKAIITLKKGDKIDIFEGA